METERLDALSKAQAEAKRICDDAWNRAGEVYKEAKKQADIVHKEAKKIAVDKQAKKVADEAHKEALEQAKKVRDAIMAEAMVVFRSSYDQATIDYDEAVAKAKEYADRAQEAYKEAKKQADILHEEAQKIAVDKQAKKEADKAHKEALEQAKKDYGEATK